MPRLLTAKIFSGPLLCERTCSDLRCFVADHNSSGQHATLNSCTVALIRDGSSTNWRSGEFHLLFALKEQTAV